MDAKDWETGWMFGEQNGSNSLGAGSSGSSLQNGSGPPSSLSTPVVATPPTPKQPEQVAMKARADKHETEDFYLTVNTFFFILKTYYYTCINTILILEIPRISAW